MTNEEYRRMMENWGDSSRTSDYYQEIKIPDQDRIHSPKQESFKFKTATLAKFDERQKALKLFRLSEGATIDQIKKRYRNFVKRHHPDVSNDADAESKFKRIEESYRILTKGNK